MINLQSLKVGDIIVARIECPHKWGKPGQKLIVEEGFPNVHVRLLSPGLCDNPPGRKQSQIRFRPPAEWYDHI